MTMPPDPPSDQPDQPDQPRKPSRNTKRTGAIAATSAVVLVSLLAGITNPFNAFFFAPVVALICVVLGSILTISESRRQFAVGFLITSAILIFVTAGVCVAAFSTALGQA